MAASIFAGRLRVNGAIGVILIVEFFLLRMTVLAFCHRLTFAPICLNTPILSVRLDNERGAVHLSGPPSYSACYA